MAPQHATPDLLPALFQNTTPQPTLLTQGAEARLYKTTFLSANTPAALKIRPAKPYRHPILDKRLTRQRMVQEARCLAKLVREGVNVPGVLAMDAENGSWLMMEWIEGVVVRVVLERWEGFMRGVCASSSSSSSSSSSLSPSSSEGEGEGEEGNAETDARMAVREEEEKKVRGLMRKIGLAVGGLHRAGVTHGDLTTSNLILRGAEEQDDGGSSPLMDGEVVLIDFGLATQSVQDEDRAVDLYVLERAFGSSHPRTEPFFEEVLVGYKESYRGAVAALKRLEDVRMRGRKRSMIG